MLWFYNHIFLFLKQMFFSLLGLDESPRRAAGEGGRRTVPCQGAAAPEQTHPPASPLPRHGSSLCGSTSNSGRVKLAGRSAITFYFLTYFCKPMVPLCCAVVSCSAAGQWRYFCRAYSRSVYLKQTAGLPSKRHCSVTSRCWCGGRGDGLAGGSPLRASATSAARRAL